VSTKTTDSSKSVEALCIGYGHVPGKDAGTNAEYLLQCVFRMDEQVSE